MNIGFPSIDKTTINKFIYDLEEDILQKEFDKYFANELKERKDLMNKYEIELKKVKKEKKEKKEKKSKIESDQD